MSDDLKKLLIVMPCYNEEAVLPQTIKVIGALLKKLIKGKKVHADSKVCFVNDGSSDKTWALIKKAAAGERIFSGISLSMMKRTASACRATLVIRRRLLPACMTPTPTCM